MQGALAFNPTYDTLYVTSDAARSSGVPGAAAGGAAGSAVGGVPRCAEDIHTALRVPLDLVLVGTF